MIVPVTARSQLWRDYLDKLNQLAQANHGAITTKQLEAAGIGSHKAARMVELGVMTRELRGIYRLGFQPATVQERRVIACLATGGALSRESAAEVWGYTELPSEVIHVTTRRKQSLRRTPWMVVHTTRRPPAKARLRDGARVVDPLRTLLDLATAGVADEHLKGFADHCISHKLFTVSMLRSFLSKSRRMPGKRRLTCLLDALFQVDSSLEAELMRLFRRAGIPLPVPGYKLKVKGRFVAKLDVAWPDLRLCTEADGFAYHSGYRSFVADRERANKIALAGFRILRFSWDNVRYDPAGVVDTVRKAIEQAKAELKRSEAAA
jgi:hypothetical protein